MHTRGAEMARCDPVRSIIAAFVVQADRHKGTVVASVRGNPKSYMLCLHRLLGFPQADLVVVLDRGRLLEQGTHAELSAGNGLYTRIYRAQRLASTE